MIDFSQEHIGHFRLEQLLVLLANEWRFANEVPWSVLQHSYAVGRAAEMLYGDNPLLVQHAYYHDLQEAVVRDVPTPLKEAVGKRWYDVENEVQTKLFRALNIAPLGDDDGGDVHALDRAMCYVEMMLFFGVGCPMLEKVAPSPTPENLVACTTAFVETKALGDFFGEDDILREDIIQHFKQIISLTVF